MKRDYNIGKKFVCFSAKERIEISKELTEKGYEFDVRVCASLFETLWVIKITGYKDTDCLTEKGE
jgi:hypothetical protein